MIVLDTHALVWWVSDAARLSIRAKGAIEHCLADGRLAVSTISVLEIATAIRRGRLELDAPFERWLDDLRALPELRFEPLSVEVASLAGSFDDTVSGDPADRIIAATALSLGARLVSADRRLRTVPQLAVVW